ncbi:MAG: DUF58 domain-containing protein [Defluviitaleaceae bacterium]|nr:DUF58 domain-containing protein [Defluviitaleaceae bacterium]
MSVTKRFALLILGGIPVVISLGIFSPFLATLMFVIYNAVVVSLFLLDFFMSPKTPLLAVKRVDPERFAVDKFIKLSHKAVNPVVFTVHNLSPYRLKIEGLDTVADRHFEVSNENLQHTISPNNIAQFSYDVTPSKRGSFTFTNIHLRVFGLLGLAIKYHVYNQPMEFKVYPNLQDLSRFRLMIRKNRLLPRGEKTVRLYGPGTEFESLRAYVDGDDYRKINWQVTAREMRLIVNDYQVEKNQPVFMLLDSGRPMSYSVKGYKKLDYAINASLVLSDIVNQKGDQSGLLVFNKTIGTVIPPGKGNVHRNNLMDALYHIEDTKDTSNYQAAFRTLCSRQKRRSIVFIFTDFETLEEAQELTAHIAQLKRWHFPIVIFMKNEELLKLAENPDSHIKEVASNFLAERKQLFRTLNAMSVPNVETPADKFSVTAVNQYLRLRG